MAAEVSVFLLLEKLKKLLAEEKVVFPGLRNRIRDAINELEKILSFLKVETLSGGESQLLLDVNSKEQIIDNFLLRRRQKGLLKLPLACRLRSQKQFSREMNELVATLRTTFRLLQEPRSAGNKDAVNSDAVQQSADEKSDSLIERGDSIKKQILDKDKSIRAIPVASAEPIGKTTLVRNIYNSVEVRKNFKWRGWVNVHKDASYKDILIILLMQTPICELKDAEQMDDKQLTVLLLKFLMENRFLIVLDDFESKDIWDMLMRPIGGSTNGSRIILTTRNNDLAKHADPLNPKHDPLKQLNELESWDLFIKKVPRPEIKNSDNPTDKEQKKNILTKCDGLPPAIVLLGGLLSKTEPKDWSTVIDHADCGGGLKDIVDLCHRKLPSRLKPCFLYFALFPKGYEISTRRLFRLWVAEGFLSMSSEVMEDVAKRYLEELVSRSMIEIASFKWDGSPKTCRMPSFLYDFILPKAVGAGFLYVNRSKSDSKSEETHKVPEAVRRLADHFDYKWTTSGSHIEQICSYVAFDYRKRDKYKTGIGILLQSVICKRSFGSLIVLDLEGVYKPILPEKLGKYFPNLKYIGLRWTGLNSFPASFADLPWLETLDLKYTNITKLPSSIWKAKNLRHLYMNEVHIQKPSSECESSLTNLQTLLGLYIGSKSRKIHGFDRCTGLRKLGLTCHPESTKETTESISELNNLKTLRLRSRNRLGQPMNIELSPRISEQKSLSKLYLFGMIIADGLNHLPKNLKMLTLSMSGLTKDPMPMLGKLTQLNILRLFHSFEGSEMTCSKGQFPKLRVLKFWVLEKLKKFTLEDGSMPELSELEIRRCEKLNKEKVNKLEGFEKLPPTLKELILTNMPKEFVEDVETKMTAKNISFTANSWDFSPLPEN